MKLIRFLPIVLLFFHTTSCKPEFVKTHEGGPQLQDFEPFVFAVIGDFGNGSDEEGEVADMVKSWDPEFIITMGDNNYSDGEMETLEENISQFYCDFIYNPACPPFLKGPLHFIFVAVVTCRIRCMVKIHQLKRRLGSGQSFVEPIRLRFITTFQTFIRRTIQYEKMYRAPVKVVIPLIARQGEVHQIRLTIVGAHVVIAQGRKKPVHFFRCSRPVTLQIFRCIGVVYKVAVEL